MVSALRDFIRRIPVQDISKSRPLPKDLVKSMLSDPEYTPLPPEACECAIVKGGFTGTVSWKRCTLLGKLDGQLADSHVRIGTGDYLMGFLGLRACRRVR